LFGSLYISGSEKDQNPVVSFIRDGTYNITLKVTNQYGTNSMTKAFIVGPNAVDQIPGAQDISIYPNPFTNQISLDASPAFSHDSFIKLFDLSGRLLKTVASADLQNVKIDASDLTTGVYILEIYNEQTLSKRKVIKQ
jgi:PKD repeat protein